MRISSLVRKARFKLFYPDLYDDNAQLRRLASYAGALRDKTIAVVGNAQSLFLHEYGPLIDQHDIVVRFNKGFVTDPARQGRRTEILGLACELPLKEILINFGNPQILWLTPLRELMADDVVEQRERLLVAPISLWERLHSDMNNARPSAGAIALHLLRTSFEPKCVSVFGFDWKATKTFYHDQRNLDWHDWSSEGRLVRRWASDDSRMTLYPPPQQAASEAAT